MLETLKRFWDMLLLKRKGIVVDNLAEWLRRKIRNLLGSARAGSNPAVVVIFFEKYLSGKKY